MMGKTLVFYRVFILECDKLVTQKSVHLAGICPDRCVIQIKKEHSVEAVGKNQHTKERSVKS